MEKMAKGQYSFIFVTMFEILAVIDRFSTMHSIHAKPRTIEKSSRLKPCNLSRKYSTLQSNGRGLFKGKLSSYLDLLV